MLGVLSTCCLFFPLYFIYKPPAFLIRYFQSRWPDVLFHHPVAKKIVALTIDDAPSAHTPEILNLLRAHYATATFFVIGSQVPGYENVLSDLVRARHELANHAMHDEPSRALSDEELTEQILAVQTMIQEAYNAADQLQGPDGWYFRPGSGFFSSRMRRVVESLGKCHYLPRPPRMDCADASGGVAGVEKRGYTIVTVSELLQEAPLR
ncbi:hypothetical protein N7451_007444 [Penicillium sp. IBT 35674x]|nr:hypothetical protein N7451_007444 [Penicillium sp. IBT 35674x]